MKFILSELTIEETIKGVLNSGTEIKLLQTKIDEDPKVKNGGQVLLFLEKYNGDAVDYSNTYVCRGLGYGHYIIKGNKVKASYNNGEKLF